MVAKDTVGFVSLNPASATVCIPESCFGDLVGSIGRKGYAGWFLCDDGKGCAGWFLYDDCFMLSAG